MKKLSKYVGKYIIIYIIAIIGLVIFTGLDMYAPILSKQIIDDVLGQGRLELLSGILGGYLLIALGRVVAGYINEYLLQGQRLEQISEEISLPMCRACQLISLTGMAPVRSCPE